MPLSRGFGIDFKDEDFSLLARAQFLKNPPKQKLVPQWSLDEALEALQEKNDISSLSYKEIFLVTLFLVAIATGNHSSELASIDRNTISFTANNREVNLPLVPGFLYKNQSASRTPPPITIPALDDDSILCPVRALRTYLDSTSQSTEKKLFCNPDSGAALNAATLSSWLCRSIQFLLPGVV